MNALVISLAAMGGLGVFSMASSLAIPKLRLRRAPARTWTKGIQVRLAQAQLDVEAPEFLLQGAVRGAILGAVGALLTSNVLVFIPFFIGGYFFYWVQLEDQRNKKINRYHHDLARAMDIIVNSWEISPTLSGALQAVVDYGPGAGEGPQGTPAPDSVAADFDEIWRALRTRTPLRQALQRVADRRRSPILDGLATALLVAEEQGAQARQTLANQAGITREQVETFNEALSRQKSKRNEALVGTLGPWLLVGMVRGLNFMVSATENAMNVEFFRTPVGISVSLLCGVITVVTYVAAMRIANRGLILTRVPTEYGIEEEGDAAS
jgi:Flp pilus assembly protein TadB